MSLHVLVGPSLATEKIKVISPKAVIHPPAKYGSVYKLIDTSCKQILLIDGLFFYNASIWHREIVAALNSGIEVFGCSSMGALRAVELSLYGMIGMGRVFDYYRLGVIDGDDEVAVIHGPESQGYESLTVPLIALRWNLDLLKNMGKLSGSDVNVIINGVKKMPFHDRSWKKIFNIKTYQGYFTNKQICELEALVLADWEDPKELDAQDALINISNRESKFISSMPKPDIPQPDYVSNAINKYIGTGSIISSKDLCNNLKNDAILDLVCIFNYVAPLVVCVIQEKKVEMTSKTNFIVRKAEAINAYSSCIVSSILPIFEFPNNNLATNNLWSKTDNIAEMTICLGYLCIISGFAIEQQVSETPPLLTNIKELYKIGADIIKSGAECLGLVSSRDDPVFAIAAQILLSNS